MKDIYDYLIVGAGLFGSVFARQIMDCGKSCLIVEKREHIGGNVYTDYLEGIHVHKYGAHIFHSSIKKSWDYIRKFAEFNNFINSPIAYYKGEVYNLPFNMNTFHQMWGVVTPEEAQEIIRSQQGKLGREPQNLEEHAISLVGVDVYNKLIKGYTEKQWGRACCELPANIMRRIPVRFIYDNSYYDTLYQGVPIGGYTQIIEKLLDGADILLNTDFLAEKNSLSKRFKKMVYTGTIDSFYDYCFGALEYRGLRFETEVKKIKNYQGNAVVNYTEREVPFTRIIEHKHFEYGVQENTVITREYPQMWKIGEEPYYPINDQRNNQLYLKYKKLSEKEKNVVFGGRLGSYTYYDMGEVINAALMLAEKELLS